MSNKILFGLLVAIVLLSFVQGAYACASKRRRPAKL